MDYSKIKVLIVDDNKLTSNIIKKKLQIFGVHPDIVHEGAEAIKILNQTAYHLVFLDYNLKYMTGKDVLLKIRRKFDSRQMKIIMLTSSSKEEIIEECLRYGADDYLLKPFDASLVKTRIDSLIYELKHMENYNNTIKCICVCNNSKLISEIKSSISNEGFSFRQISTLADIEDDNELKLYDIVLLDYEFIKIGLLPVIEKKFKEKKIILCVKKTDILNINNFLNKQFCDYVIMPDFKQLEQKITYQLFGEKMARKPTDNLNILIIEDTKLYQKIMQGIFKNDKHKLTFADNGKEAINELLSNKFDLVFMDMNLPDISGFDLLKYIRENKSLSEIPIIITSSLNDKSKIREAILKGASEYVVKPFNSKIIHTRIDAVFSY